jgi:hypothetical protein
MMSAEDEPKGLELPAVYMIPDDVLTKWVNTAPEHPLTIPITKAEIDNLYFAIFRSVGSITELAQALQAFSHGQTAEANKHFADAAATSREAENRIKQFFTAIITRATAGH